MKKLLSIAALAALLPLLFSCGQSRTNQDDVLTEPRFVQYAGQLVPQYTLGSKADIAPLDVDEELVSFIELTESGIYVVALTNVGVTNYITGTYTVNGDNYILNGFGTINFTGTSGNVMLSIQRDGKDWETIPATLTRASGSNQLYRGWTVDKVRVKIGSAGADFNGLNFNDIAKFLKDNNFDVPADFPKTSVKSVSITGAGSFIIGYSDNTADIASFNMSGSNFTFDWRGEEMGFEFETGKATIEMMDGKCVLSLSTSVENESGSVTLVLSPIA